MKKHVTGVMAVCTMIVMTLGLPACKTAPEPEASKAEKRADIRDMADEALGQWYAQQPSAQDEVKQSVGYAVFSDMGFKVLFMGGAKGKGIAVNNSDKRTYYMEMLELQPGLGLGGEKFRMVFLFSTKEAFHHFVTSGWEAGANAMALAKTSSMDHGGAKSVSVLPGVRMYQLTDEGIVAGVSITGAKFYKDSELE